MGNLLALITGNKTLVMGIILAIVLGGMTIYIKVLKNDVARLNAEKDSISLQLQVSQNSVTSLRDSINDQNVAIDKLKSDADARVAAHKAEIDAANAKAGNYKRQATDLMNRTIPPNDTACKAANDLMNEVLKNAK